MSPLTANRAYRLVKRSLDATTTALGLFAAAPVLAATSAAVLVTMGRPIFFRQARPGLDGVPFELIKFRTMRVCRPGESMVASDSDRLTRIGRLLRSTSIDELPTLWNVLRGDMSLVGPRPLLMRYLPLYSSRQSRRHAVLPGVTGWAQIHGRNAQSWEERFELDLWYVEHCSLRVDFTILLRTFATVLMRSGVAEAGNATHTEFIGRANRQPPRDSE